MRTNWKAKYEKAETELKTLNAELERVSMSAGELRARAEQAEAEVENMQRRLDRAKLEGARGLANFMLGELE